jgi:23S rRNA (cytidine1920-2'-O)/16S rRNA (cytidine1409-2'-O)-methyltransferase
MMAHNNRLDSELVKRNLVESRTLAQRMIMAGEVRVDDVVHLKPSHRVSEDSRIEVTGKPRFVSRGGLKLEPALHSFGINNLIGKVCADVGASTGGFTDCLLQYGAEKVYAIDVGYGVLHWQLRNDPRVIVMERTNARYVNDLPEIIHLATIDASFISLKILLPVVKGWFLNQRGDIIALVKPQFEAGRKAAAKHDGVILETDVHKRVLREVLSFGVDNGFTIHGLIQSPIKGPKGNIEYLAHLVVNDEQQDSLPLDELVREVFENA